MSGSFDRIAPPAERGRTRPGRAALFSDPGGCVRLRCERCQAQATPGPGDVLRGVPWVLVPRRGYPMRGRCPTCRRRAWLGVTAGGRAARGWARR